MAEVISRECCFRTDNLPFSKAVWEVTFACPLKCPYCFQERTGHRNDISRADMHSVREGALRFLQFMQPRSVLLSGGEPLTLGEDLFKLIESIKEMGADFSVSTTGFPQEVFLRMLEFGPGGINISIDPAGMEGNQYEYRKTKFETLLATLQAISSKRIPIKGTSLITKENLQNVPAYVDMLRTLAAKAPTLRTLFITNPYHIGYARPDLSVKPSDVEEFVGQVRSLATSSIDLRFINFSSIALPLQDCPAAASIFSIVPNGDVVGCPFLYQRSSSFAVGNVAENPADVIRRSLERFRGFLTQNMHQLICSTPECVECPAKQECHGGCFAESFAMKETSIPALLCKRTAQNAQGRDEKLLSLPLQVRRKLMAGRPKASFERSSLDPELEVRMASHVREYMKHSFSDIAHRFDHVEAVVQLAKTIATQEKANKRIVVPAAYFHDFAPRQHEAFHFHTDESADAAATFLNENGFDADEITAIVHCIVASEFSSYLLGIEPRTIEARVVRDADFLESMGARGIARAFAFAGKHCAELGDVDYDPYSPPFTHHNIMAPDTTPIQHFAAKLLLLNRLLLTASGKGMGRRRHKLMLDFLLQYKNEMKGVS
ncbi:MAG: radical SAM protein [Acidobacteriia bacterium]|nr:radical SAM protein [Terriglobia bacterium]